MPVHTVTCWHKARVVLPFEHVTCIVCVPVTLRLCGGVVRSWCLVILHLRKDRGMYLDDAGRWPSTDDEEGTGCAASSVFAMDMTTSRSVNSTSHCRSELCCCMRSSRACCTIGMAATVKASSPTDSMIDSSPALTCDTWMCSRSVSVGRAVLSCSMRNVVTDWRSASSRTCSARYLRRVSSRASIWPRANLSSADLSKWLKTCFR